MKNPFKNDQDEKNYDHEIFVIFDSKTSSYTLPSFAMNHHDLVRQIINMFNDPAQAKNQLLVNAEDFSIFRTGYYSKSTGEINPCKLTHIANLHDLRALTTPPSRGVIQNQDAQAVHMGIVPT